MTSSEFEQACQIIGEFSGAHFMQVHYGVSRHLEGDGSSVLVISYFLNHLRMRVYNETGRKELKKNEMWFLCPAKDIQTDLGIKPDRMTRVLKNLEQYELIEKTRRRGPAPDYGNFLWVRINTKKLQTLVIGHQKSPGNPQNGVSRFSENPEVPQNRETPFSMKTGKPRFPLYDKRKVKREEGAARPRRATPSRNGHAPSPPTNGLLDDNTPDDDLHLQQAKQLRKALHTKAGVIQVQGTDKAGACHFEKLTTALGDRRTQKVLDWFCDNCDKRSIEKHGLPTITSARQFCLRIDWIKEKWEKDTGHSDDTTPEKQWPEWQLKQWAENDEKNRLHRIKLLNDMGIPKERHDRYMQMDPEYIAHFEKKLKEDAKPKAPKHEWYD